MLALRQHLYEYREKYTVYDDIVLLAPSGQVLARLLAEDGLVSSAGMPRGAGAEDGRAMPSATPPATGLRSAALLRRARHLQ